MIATRIVFDAKTKQSRVEEFEYTEPPKVEIKPVKSEVELLLERVVKLESDVTALKATKETIK